MTQEQGKLKHRVHVQVTIVTYRTAELVIRSLKALGQERELLSPQGVSVSCFVIDNSGEDHEKIRAALKQQGFTDWIHVVAADRNGGFAYGNNRGFEYGFAQATPPDYFFLLNPDAEVRAGALGELVSFMEAHPRAGTAASIIEMENGELWPYAFRFHNLVDEVQRGLRIGAVSRLLSRYLVARKMGSEAEQVDWSPGAAMLCRAETVRQLGGMDEAYFLYFEETDFCLKLTRNGWTNWYVPTSRVMHVAGQSTGVTGAGTETQRRPKYWFESRRRYFVKNHGILHASLVDVGAISANMLGNLQLILRGKKSEIREKFLSDLMRESCVVPGQGQIPEAKERLNY